jgi:hypothetical protein
LQCRCDGALTHHVLERGRAVFSGRNNVVVHAAKRGSNIQEFHNPNKRHDVATRSVYQQFSESALIDDRIVAAITRESTMIGNVSFQHTYICFTGRMNFYFCRPLF